MYGSALCMVLPKKFLSFRAIGPRKFILDYEPEPALFDLFIIIVVISK